MKFLKLKRRRYYFQIADKEKALLFSVLRLYPATPVAYQKLSKTEQKKEAQELLESALAEQQAANKKQVTQMMKSKSRLRRDKSGWRFSLSSAQMESLLQVLNDIRVGSWLALGLPDDMKENFAARNEQTVPNFWALEVCSEFQLILLDAIEGK